MKKFAALLSLLMILCILVNSCAVTPIFKPPSNPAPVSSSPAVSSLTPQPSETLKNTPLAGLYSLITEPTDGIIPVISLIHKASKSIDLVMYEMEDSQIEKALVTAKSQGVVVRVLLNQGYYTQPAKDNEAAYQDLQSEGVGVHWTPTYFALTHQKTVVMDGNQALIMTFNFTPQYYSADRDFGIIDNDQSDISAIEATFNDDWQSAKDKPSQADNLVWSPGADTTILALINNSHKSLFIENEEMADSAIENAMIAASQRGVSVEVVMTYSSQWANDFKKLVTGGVKIRTYSASASLYIHAKTILADGATAFVGSQNFSATSLKDNRELGILLTDPGILSSLGDIFQRDWNGGTP